MKKALVGAGLVLFLILLVFLIFGTSVPSGHTGIVTTFGKVEDNTLSPGFSFKSPFQSVTKMDNRQQKIQYSILAFSTDIQEVAITATLTYSVDKTASLELFRSVGVNYPDVLISPKLEQFTKEVFSNYTAANLVTNREQLPPLIIQNMEESLSRYNIVVGDVTIQDIDFSDTYTNAVELKQVAEQQKLQVQTEESTRTAQEKAVAERAVITAQASAEKRIIDAGAEAEETALRAQAEANRISTTAKAEAEAALEKAKATAEGNKKIAESLTPELIEFQVKSKWNGTVPTVAIGDLSELFSTILPK